MSEQAHIAFSKWDLANRISTPYGSVDKALIRGAEEGNAPLVRLALAVGADKEARDAFECTPLARASANGHAEICKILLEAGANTEARDRFGIAPLMCAAGNGHAEICMIFLEAGANAEAWDKFGRSAYDFAQGNGHQIVMEILKSKMVKILATDLQAVFGDLAVAPAAAGAVDTPQAKQSPISHKMALAL